MMFRLLYLVLFSSSFASVAIANEESDGLPERIIDMHAHVWHSASESQLSAFGGVLDRYNIERIMISGYAEDIELVIRQIQSMSFLTQEQKDDIFYGNAARFIGLEPGYETQWRAPQGDQE